MIYFQSVNWLPEASPIGILRNWFRILEPKTVGSVFHGGPPMSHMSHHVATIWTPRPAVRSQTNISQIWDTDQTSKGGGLKEGGGGEGGGGGEWGRGVVKGGGGVQFGQSGDQPMKHVGIIDHTHPHTSSLHPHTSLDPDCNWATGSGLYLDHRIRRPSLRQEISWHPLYRIPFFERTETG